jgi:hypothetical protein
MATMKIVAIVLAVGFAHAQSTMNVSGAIGTRDAKTLITERFDPAIAPLRSYPVALGREATIEIKIAPNKYDVALLAVSGAESPAYPTASKVLIQARLQPNGKVGLTMASKGGECAIESAAVLSLDQAVDVAFSYGTRLKMYINGALAGTSADCAEPAAAPAYVHIVPEAHVEGIRVSDVQRSDSMLAAAVAAEATFPMSLVVPYRGTVDVVCPTGGVAVIGSCNATNDWTIYPPEPGRDWYITATSLHCSIGGRSSSVALLRCSAK